MPAYLLHGFRWPRAGLTGIRVHAIVHNLEDTSVDYIQNANSSTDILKSFRTAFPNIMKEVEGPGKRGLTFLEQYDPDDLVGENIVCQPYAFVGYRVVTLAGGPMALNTAASDRPGSSTTRISDQKSPGPARQAVSKSTTMDGSALSVNVEDVIAEGPGLSTTTWEALADLRDKIAENEKIGWWIVYNGDPERAYDEDTDPETTTEEEDSDEDDEEAEMSDKTPTPSSPIPIRRLKPTHSGNRQDGNSPSQRPPVPAKDAPRPPPSRPQIPSQGTGKRTPAPLHTKGRRYETDPGSDSGRPKTASKSGRLKNLFGEKERSRR